MKSFRWLSLLLAVLAALTALTVIIELRAGRELRWAEEAMTRNDTAGAIKHYGRCLNWYVPWGSAETAAERLLILGRSLAGQGRVEEAVRSLAGMRSGLYGARSLFTPRRDLLAAAEPELAGLRARQKLCPEASPEAAAKQAQVYLDLMRRPARPQTGAAGAAAGGFFIWVLATFVFIKRFFHQKGRSWVRAWPWVLVWAGGFGLWLWGLTWA